jgi:thiol-disulfide isomerase/thioredoxin
MKLARLAAVGAALVLGACSSVPVATGELPGRVPDGVTFREAPDTAPAAPVFELELLDGQVLDMTELWSERPVVLVFFESWCSLCREQQPEINEVAEEYQDVVLFVGIAGISDPADVEEYVADNRITYPVGTDPDGMRWLRYAVAEPPLVALISKDGRLLRGWPGGISGDALREQIEQHAVAAH